MEEIHNLSDSEYLEQKIKPIYVELVRSLMSEKPADIAKFVVNFMKNTQKTRINFSSSIPEENEEENSNLSIYSSYKPKINLKEFFKNSFMLHSLNDDETKTIAKNHILEESSGSILYNSGECLKSFYILKKGTIEFMGKKGKEGEASLYGPIEPTDLFGLSSYLKGIPQQLTAIASSDIIVIKVSKLNDHLKNLLSLKLYEVEKLVDFSKALKEKDDFQKEISIDKSKYAQVVKNSHIPEFPYSIYVIIKGAISKITDKKNLIIGEGGCFQRYFLNEKFVAIVIIQLIRLKPNYLYYRIHILKSKINKNLMKNFFFLISIIVYFSCILKTQQQENKFFNSSIHTLELFGNIDFGYYYVNLFVGDPPQKQTVIIDTGSELTAFPCNGYFEFILDCEVSDCGDHIDSHFNSSASLTVNALDCERSFGNYHCNCDQKKRCQFSIVTSKIMKVLH